MVNTELINSIRSIDWEFANVDTQYLTHSIHRYSGKFIPQIAGTAISLVTSPGDTILDSYMGSGTTLLEAQLLGRNSIGVDINPLAVLISRVKNMRLSAEDTIEIVDILIPYVKYLINDGQLTFDTPQIDENAFQNRFSANGWRLENTWNNKWYQPAVLMQLVKIFSCIETLKSERARDISFVAFSDILRKSSNASSKYPNVMYDKNAQKKPLPGRAFLESIEGILAALREASKTHINAKITTEIFLKSNLDLPLNDSSIDAIITHPPYIAAIPYAEYGCLNLEWLGYDNRFLDSVLTGGRRHSSNVVSRFSADYERYFVESYRVLRSQKYMFIMVGNPIVHGEKVPLDQISIELAEKAGFKHIVTTIRKGQNRRGNKMGEEYLIFLQKQ